MEKWEDPNSTEPLSRSAFLIFYLWCFFVIFLYDMWQCDIVTCDTEVKEGPLAKVFPPIRTAERRRLDQREKIAALDRYIGGWPPGLMLCIPRGHVNAVNALHKSHSKRSCWGRLTCLRGCRVWKQAGYCRWKDMIMVIVYQESCCACSKAEIMWKKLYFIQWWWWWWWKRRTMVSSVY